MTAPGEESWDEIRDLEAEKAWPSSPAASVDTAHYQRNRQRNGIYKVAFDRAIERVAKPLLKERDEARAELSSLKATEAALREELTKAKKSISACQIEWYQKAFRTVAKDRDTLRQQLAEAIETLEYLRAGAEEDVILPGAPNEAEQWKSLFYRDRQHLIDEINKLTAKLKAPAAEEGK